MNNLYQNNEKPCVATIGSFDGVHIGHRYLIGQVIRLAEESGLASMVVTFPNHPVKVLHPDYQPKLLSLADDKVQLLRTTGVDLISLVEFTRELSMLSAREFMQKVLKERFNVRVLVIGYDNHFGHDRKSFPDLLEYGKEMGIKVVQSEELPSELKASSTIVREALQRGDIDAATAVLGHPYTIKGKVVNGFHVGTKIGFPTANICVHPDKLLPMYGAYCVRALGHIGMMNIGYRPTLDNGPQRSIEVHLLDFDRDIYGEEIEIEFVKFLRGERKFGSVEELRLQLKKDENECQKYL